MLETLGDPRTVLYCCVAWRLSGCFGAFGKTCDNWWSHCAFRHLDLKWKWRSCCTGAAVSIPCLIHVTSHLRLHLKYLILPVLCPTSSDDKVANLPGPATTLMHWTAIVTKSSLSKHVVLLNHANLEEQCFETQSGKDCMFFMNIWLVFFSPS